MSVANEVSAEMTGVFGGFAAAGVLAYAVTRSRSAERQANQAACDAAASGARVDVLRRSAAANREKAYEAIVDADILREQNGRLFDEIRRLKAEIRRLESLTTKRAA